MQVSELDALAASVLDAARHAGATIGCAESCTGGMIAQTLTDIAGSSDVFVGGVVSYWVSVKESVLGVPAGTVEQHGVVSSEVVQAMALGALGTLGCDYAVSTTGIAGPGGAEPGKPVGTVWIGVASREAVRSVKIVAQGHRSAVRTAATARALKMLRDALRDAS